MLIIKDRTEQAIVWTIAGSDCAGGAGIQADLKSFQDFDVHGCSVISAVTAQNTQNLSALQVLDETIFKQQLQVLKNDLPPMVIKLGMLANETIVNCVCDFLSALERDNKKPLVVCDPVLSASVGGQLLSAAAQQLLSQRLLPLVDLLTPNIIELEQLSGCAINSFADIKNAAQKLLMLGTRAVYVKGGHSEKFIMSDDHTHVENGAHDGRMLFQKKAQHDFVWDFFISATSTTMVTAPQEFWLRSKKYPATAHGTGCRLASAIAALLARDYALEDAVSIAKTYISAALEAAYQVGAGALNMPSVKKFELKHLPQIFFTQSNALEYVFPTCQPIHLYPVVDDVSWLKKLLALGVKTIQLRLKNKPLDEVEQQIKCAVELQIQYNAQVFINDYWSLAIKHGAYGVHLGQEDLFSVDVAALQDAGLRLGVSTHSWWEISRAHSLQPSYIAIGPIYPTQTKEMPFHAQGLQKLEHWHNLLAPRYPVVAIGGIDLMRAKALRALGIEHIALVSAITQAENYQAVTQDLLALFS